MTLITVSWLTESGHPTREHIGGKPGQTMCGREVPSNHTTRTVTTMVMRTAAARERFDYLRVDLCHYCRRKLKKAEAGK